MSVLLANLSNESNANEIITITNSASDLVVYNPIYNLKHISKLTNKKKKEENPMAVDCHLGIVGHSQFVGKRTHQLVDYNLKKEKKKKKKNIPWARDTSQAPPTVAAPCRPEWWP